MKIAIIGAGMAGVTAARHLQNSGNVTLFDKSRGAGGRMSTRRAEPFEFDHGAQYFTVKDSRFQSAVIEAVANGHIEAWDATGVYRRGEVMEPDTGAGRFVSTPRMNSWVKAMASNLDVRLNHRVTQLTRNKGRWTLYFDDGSHENGFDWLVMTAPPAQVSALFPDNFQQAAELDAVKMDACFALMIGLDETPDVAWDSMRQEDGPAAWIAINSAKPRRPARPTLMVHSGPDWSNAHIESDRERVLHDMIEAASISVGVDLKAAAYQTLHFWRYAAVRQGASTPCLVDRELKLIAAGDWCLGGRVEGAYLSGLAAAEAVKAHV